MDGGPACPIPESGETTLSGMSLRDYFAGQALVGIIAQDTAEYGYDKPTDIAQRADLLADALLKARGAAQTRE